MNPRYLRHRLSRYHLTDDAQALLRDCQAAGVPVHAVRRLTLGFPDAPDFGAIDELPVTDYQLPNKRED